MKCYIVYSDFGIKPVLFKNFDNAYTFAQEWIDKNENESIELYGESRPTEDIYIWEFGGYDENEYRLIIEPIKTPV